MTISSCSIAAGLALGIAGAGTLITGTALAAEPYTLQYTADGELIRPAGELLAETHSLLPEDLLHRAVHTLEVRESSAPPLRPSSSWHRPGR